MPHLVILYTPNLDPEIKMSTSCRRLVDIMIEQRDEDGGEVFPTGGTRSLAFSATHFAVADGGAAGVAASSDGDYGFLYLNLRMESGRSDNVKHSNLHPLFRE